MQEPCLLDSVKYSQQLHNWYSTPAGQILSKELANKLGQLLPSLFGYYAIQAGSICSDMDLLESSAIGKKIYMGVNPNQGSVAASPLALPFPEDTLDLIILPHTLDFSHDPHQVLREVHRVLISEGHVVLIAFNPVSMMGLCKLALARSKRAPWAGHFYTARRLKDWLALLDFTVIETKHIGICSPLQNLHIQKRLGFFDKVNHFGMGALGGVQIFVAKKHELTLTPTPQPWRPRRRILQVNIAEPTVRQAHNVGTSRYLH